MVSTVDGENEKQISTTWNRTFPKQTKKHGKNQKYHARFVVVSSYPAGSLTGRCKFRGRRDTVRRVRTYRVWCACNVCGTSSLIYTSIACGYVAYTRVYYVYSRIHNWPSWAIGRFRVNTVFAAKPAKIKPIICTRSWRPRTVTTLCVQHVDDQCLDVIQTNFVRQIPPVFVLFITCRVVKSFRTNSTDDNGRFSRLSSAKRDDTVVESRENNFFFEMKRRLHWRTPVEV